MNVLRGRGLLMLFASTLLALSGFTVLVSGPASATPLTVYAFAPGVTAGSCLSMVDNCDLQSALTSIEGAAGGTIELETTGSSAHYDGGFTFDTEGGSFTIEPPSTSVTPVLDGMGSDRILELTDSSSNGSVTIHGVTLTEGNAASGAGGAINLESSDTLTVDHSTMTDNVADEGGAIAASNNDDDAPDGSFVSTLNITDSSLSHNAAANEGGAVSDGNGAADSTLNITSSSFTSNDVSDPGGSSDCGGALSIGENYSSGATASIVDSSFTNNVLGPSSYSYGGGGAICSGSDEGSADLMISGSSFYGNSTDITTADYGGGGAISLCAYRGAGCLTAITTSTFESNSTSDADDIGGGGAIASGTAGGIGSSLDIDTTNFFTNETNDTVLQGGGGAISNATASGGRDGSGGVDVNQSAFVSNTSRQGAGGAIMNASGGGTGSVLVTQSTFVDNSANEGGALANGSLANATWIIALRSTFNQNTDPSGLSLYDASGASTILAGDYISGANEACNTYGFVSDGYNATQSNAPQCGSPVSSDLLGITADLPGIATNGGSTQSELPPEQSPLNEAIPSGTMDIIEGVDYALCPTPGGDQEGVVILSGASCDIGALDNPNAQLPASAIAAPLNIAVTGSYSTEGKSSGSLNAVWTRVNGATSYLCTLLYGFSNPSNFTVTTTSPTCTFDQLALTTSYGIQVVAKSGSLTSTATYAFAETPPAIKVQKTITCHRGTRIVRRTGIAPKCPSGYKRGR